VKRLGVAAFLALTVVGGAFAAAAPIEIFAEHAVVTYRDDPHIQGRVAGARMGTVVLLQRRECGRTEWEEFSRAITNDQGQWQAFTTLLKTTDVRARQGTTTSDVLRVTVRPWLSLTQRGNRWTVSVMANDYFRGSRARLERFDRASGRWVLAKLVRLDRAYSQSVGTVTFRARRGTNMRASFAKPNACYAGAVSRIVSAL
jgi:hypothetical protein